VYTTQLRKVGEEVMLDIPCSMLKQLNMREGDRVELCVDQRSLIVAPAPRPRYTLAELMAASDFSQPRSSEEIEWMASPAVGRELL